MKCKPIIFSAVAALLFLPQPGETCGPYFSTPDFVRTESPDPPVERFAEGKIGVVLPTWKVPFRVVAYRYLIGKPLSAEEQKSLLEHYDEDGRIAPPDEAKDAINAWVTTRNRFRQDPVERPGMYKSTQDGFSEFPNCLASAFDKAAVTLDERARQLGATSPELQEWITGQDAVFLNCDRKNATIPSDLPNSSDPLLRADRAYQIAAAHFYAGSTDDLETARLDFQAIGEDTSSPWRSIAPYLVARTWVREAAVTAAKDQAFNMDVLKKAEIQLDAILADARQASIHDAATDLLASGAGKHFGQDLIDYSWLEVPSKRNDDLTKWIENGSSANGAVAEWRRSHQDSWLLAALWQIKPENAAFSELMDTAASVPVSSAAFPTVAYLRLRFAKQTGDLKLAHQILNLALKHQDRLPLSSRHLFQDEQVQLAGTFNAFVTSLNQMPVDFDDGAGDIEYCTGGAARKCEPEFSPAVATVLNTRVPDHVFARVAESPALPLNLRRRLAPAAWARAALLDDMQIASEIAPSAEAAQPMMRPFIQQFSNAKTAAERRFVAVYIILHFPGLRPFSESTDLRSTMPLRAISEFRDNWWGWSVGGNVASPNFGFEGNAGPGDGRTQFQVEPASATSRARIAWMTNDKNFPRLGFPEFLREQDKDVATNDWDKLFALKAASDFLPKVVLEWGRMHPDDPRVPEALHLSIRAMRYSSSNRLSHAAFLMLHDKYPQSEWAKKTPYWFKD